MAKVRSVLLLPLLVAAVAAASGCEEEAIGIHVGRSEMVPVLTCVARLGEPVRVSVTGSVAYSDTVEYEVLDSAYVDISLGDSVTHHATLGGGAHVATFGGVLPGSGDKLTVAVRALGLRLTGALTIPDTVRLTRVDTLTYGGRLRLTAFFLDNVARQDQYQIDVLRREWRGGAPSDSAVACDYENYLFQAAQVNIGFGSRSIGLFADDGRVPGRYAMSLSTDRAPFDSVPPPGPAHSRWTMADSVQVVVRLHHHSEEYYRFLQTSVSSQTNMLLPVFSSSAVFSNVQGGGRGIVAGSARTEYAVTTWPPPPPPPEEEEEDDDDKEDDAGATDQATKPEEKNNEKR